MKLYWKMQVEISTMLFAKKILIIYASIDRWEKNVGNYAFKRLFVNELAYFFKAPASKYSNEYESNIKNSKHKKSSWILRWRIIVIYVWREESTSPPRKKKDSQTNQLREGGRFINYPLMVIQVITYSTAKNCKIIGL